MSRSIEAETEENRDPNRWRLETPGVQGWTRTARPDASDKYSEGFRPIRLRDIKFDGEDHERAGAGLTPEQRLADHARDGIDCEVMFPNLHHDDVATVARDRERR